MVALAYTALGILWAIFGSFASALIPRLKEGRNLTHERSACPNCQHALGTFDLFPIFSFALLRGKCRYCKARIPPYHFLLECLMSGIFLLTGYGLVDIGSVLAGDSMEICRLILFLVAGFVAVTFSVYDLLYMEIPDEILLPFLLILFVFICYDHFSGNGLFGYFLPMTTPWLASPLANALLGSGIIFGFFLLQIVLSDGAWLGGWDLRIALFMGLLAGTKIALLGLFLAYITGSIIGIGILAVKRSRNIAVPFGPYLAVGLYLALLYHTEILRWYFGLLNTN